MLTAGLVFGKFYPFHKGHLALINFAKKHCQHLSVILCCSDKETALTPQQRFTDTIASIADPTVNVILFEYREDELPNTSQADDKVAQVWSEVFTSLLPNIDVVMTSEEYGDAVAKYLNAEHVLFDRKRTQVSIRASQIRENPAKYWPYLPNPVKQRLQKSIIISGTESTGKSHLATKLSNYFNAPLVTEAGRDLIQDSNCFDIPLLTKVAIIHAENILEAKEKLTPFIIIDTDVYITQSYALSHFDEALQLDDWIYQANQSDLRLYLDKEVPFIQDGTRLSYHSRNLLDRQHRKTLNQFGQSYVTLSGNYAKREQLAIEKIKQIRKMSPQLISEKIHTS